MKNSKDAQIGETFCHVNFPVTPLEGFKPAKPMVTLKIDLHTVRFLLMIVILMYVIH